MAPTTVAARWRRKCASARSEQKRSKLKTRSLPCSDALSISILPITRPYRKDTAAMASPHSPGQNHIRAALPAQDRNAAYASAAQRQKRNTTACCRFVVHRRQPRLTDADQAYDIGTARSRARIQGGMARSRQEMGKLNCVTRLWIRRRRTADGRVSHRSR